MVYSLDHILYAFSATLFTWGMTAAGAATVFFFKTVNKGILSAMLCFASGVMIAASFWSLLLPAAQMCEAMEFSPYAPLMLGFICGGGSLFAADYGFSLAAKRKRTLYSDTKKRSAMLILSITLHNIPEGLCVGVAFGALAYEPESASLASAVLLALGIGIQNFPEGAAVSLPMRREGYSRRCAFFWGQISGAVEPISAIMGAMLVLYVRILLPFCLSFAAGAMIYVVAAELIPEGSTGNTKNVSALFTIIGFALMMLLDITFG